MSDYLQPPAVAAVLKMLRSKHGATIAQIAKARGSEEHSIRSIMSRLRSKAGLSIEMSKHPRRGNVFKIK